MYHLPHDMATMAKIKPDVNRVKGKNSRVHPINVCG